MSIAIAALGLRCGDGAYVRLGVFARAFCGGGFSQPRARSHFVSDGRKRGASAAATHASAASKIASCPTSPQAPQ